MAKSVGIIGSSIAVIHLVTNPGFAVAKSKKLTLDQAWAVCKAEIDRNITKGNEHGRYAAGGACMLRRGYRI
jgi:hypothetical protein